MTRVFAVLAALTAVVAAAACGGSSPTGFAARFRVDGGRQLFIVCRGTGTPTVVLEGDQGDLTSSWTDMLADLDTSAQVCIYDRAGLGLSDPITTAATPDRTVADLSALLDAAHVQRPYILAGIGMGGLLVRLFAQRYASRVAGIVLLDAIHEDGQARLAHVLATLSPSVAPGPLPGPVPGTIDVGKLAQDIRSEPRAGSLGDLPLIVVTAGAPTFGAGNPGGLDPSVAQTWRPIWLSLQTDLVSLSSKGRQLVVAGVDLNLPYQPTREVVKAIRALIIEARRANST